MPTGAITYEDFRVGDVTVTVMRLAYSNRVYYKHKVTRTFKNNEGQYQSTPWLEYGADEGSEASARRRATQWVRKQQIEDQRERAQALPDDFDNEI